jgi:hypothetical protein
VWERKILKILRQPQHTKWSSSFIAAAGAQCALGCMQRARHNNNRAPRDAVFRDAEGHLVPRLCCHAGPDLKSGERGVEDHLIEMLEHHQKPMNSLVFWVFC